MGGYSQNLAVDLPEGYVGRWFNDVGDRIRRALRAGYQPVLKDGTMGDVNVSGGDEADMGQWTNKRVGKGDNGPLMGYLMAIKKEWYDEDQAKKQRDLDMVDEAIKGNTLTPEGNLDGQSYHKATLEHNAPFIR